MSDLEKPQFIETDVQTVLDECVAEYEHLTGRPLYPAQSERLLINLIAYREHLVRVGIQEAAEQNLVAFARAPMLDYLGELVGVTRLPAQPAHCTLRFSLADTAVSPVFISAGTGVYSTDGKYLFSTEADVTIKAGAAMAEVSAVADGAGTAANGLQPGNVSVLADEVTDEALARLIARLSALPTETPLINLLDIVTPAALSLLGEQFHILGLEGWNQARSEVDRRLLVKRAVDLHRHKGTPWAVKEALRGYLGRSVTVREWFQYGGNPYFFRAGFDVTESGLHDAELSAVFGLVETWKNKRSWLDALETAARVELPLLYGATDVTRTHTHVYGYMAVPKTPDATLRTALAVSERDVSVLALSMPEASPAPSLPVRIAVLVRERTHGVVGMYQEKTRLSALADVPVLTCIVRTRSRIAAE